MNPTLFEVGLLDELGAAARSGPRRRAHRTLHQTPEQPCQRMLVAIEPDSYVPPHRHLDPHKAESLVVLRGELGVLWFEPSGALVGTARLRPADVGGVDIPAGLFHSVLALEPGTVFFEAKAGPWHPLQAAEQADFAPREGAPGAAAFLTRMRGGFTDPETAV